MTIPGRVAVCAALVLALVGCGQVPMPKITATAGGSGTAAPSTTSATPTTNTTVPDRQPRKLVLKATGTVKITSVKYTLDNRVRKKGKVKLPWRQPVTVPADGKPHSWRLEVKFTGSGHVKLVAIFDGAVVAQGGSGGSGNVSGGASVGGAVRG